MSRRRDHAERLGKEESGRKARATSHRAARLRSGGLWYSLPLSCHIPAIATLGLDHSSSKAPVIARLSAEASNGEASVERGRWTLVYC